MSLPSGTVTFLFTDIEGSAKLWERFPEAMRVALARHDALLHEAVETHNGVVFKTMGDAFCAAFATAPDALAAALSGQRALIAEPWESGIPLRVRMALHAGDVELREGDYFGQPLNRVARLLSIGHGGQILLSDVAHDLSRDSLPPDVAFTSLGEHRLRDLGRPEAVFQLRHPDLPAEFPPLKSLNNPNLPNNLPQQLTSFIGREREIEAVKSLLAKTRLLTLTGSGGCGKTRLGLQVAAEMLDGNRDGVWYVDLAPITDPALVAQTAASAMGVSEEAGVPLMQTLLQAAKNRQMFLFLDNCEHLLNACARLADALLRNGPNLQILAGSREGLGIAGEQIYRVPSLSLPDLNQRTSIENLSQYEAVRLFVERAVLARADFTATNQNVPALAQLCVRLDGIPMALELAAARVRSLSVEEINAKLDNRFRLLTGGSRTALPRQQTLRALIDWSYDLLSDQEKALMGRLSVFVGGGTLEAAAEIGTSDRVEDWEVLDLLTSLVDKSLVIAEAQDGQTRYRMLETMRQYARERLAEAGSEEETAAYERHARYYLAFARERLSRMRTPQEAEALRELEAELDNLRAAVEWAKQAVQVPLYPELALCAGRLLQRRGFLPEAAAHVQGGLDTLRPEWAAYPGLAAELLRERAGLHLDYREAAAARQCAFEAIALSEGRGDAGGQAKSENLLGQAAMQVEDYDAARTHFAHALKRVQELGDTVDVAVVLNNLGLVERRDCSGSEEERQTRLTTAEGYLKQALSLRRALSDQRGLAETLNNLGVTAQEKGDWERAWACYAEAVSYEQEVRHMLGVALLLANLGEIAELKGDTAHALRLFAASETLLEELQSPLAADVAEMTVRAASSQNAADVETARGAARALPAAARITTALRAT